MNKSYAIVLAGGSGSRMGGDIPKQYRLLKEIPVLCYSLRTFENSAVEGIVIVTADNMQEYVSKELVEKYNIKKIAAITAGGSERYLSVWQGLQCLPDTGTVLVHDGARPFVSEELIGRVLEGAQTYRACIPGIPVKDTIKQVSEQRVVHTPPRRELYAVQTPQAFDLAMLKEAYHRLLGGGKDNVEITDDAMLVETILGETVHVVEGDIYNMKLTTPEDMLVAEIFANNLKKR